MVVDPSVGGVLLSLLLTGLAGRGRRPRSSGSFLRLRRVRLATAPGDTVLRSCSD
jgi:hypothetical protein